MNDSSEPDGAAVKLRLGDDGCGFDALASHRGYGLAGMCERAEALSGTFAVVSKAGAGTVIEAEFPVVGASERRSVGATWGCAEKMLQRKGAEDAKGCEGFPGVHLCDLCALALNVFRGRKVSTR